MTLRPDSDSLTVAMEVLKRRPLATSILCQAHVAAHADENWQIIFPPSSDLSTFHGRNQFAGPSDFAGERLDAAAEFKSALGLIRITFRRRDSCFQAGLTLPREPRYVPFTLEI